MTLNRQKVRQTTAAKVCSILWLLFSAVAAIAQTPVAEAPKVTQSPRSGTAMIGRILNLRANGSGSAPLRFQWLKNGVPIVNANSSALTFSSVTAVDGGSYSAVISNALGRVTTGAATITTTNVSSAATIGGDLPEVSISDYTLGGYVGDVGPRLYAFASGPGPLRYQWYKNGLVMNDQTEPNMNQGAAISLVETTLYSVDVTNGAGTVRENFSFTPKDGEPVFTQPIYLNGDNTVWRGLSFSMLYGLAGNKPMTVNVYKAGTLVSTGGPLDSYGKINATDADGGTYLVVATNARGSVSREVQLTVKSSAPIITRQPRVYLMPYGNGQLVTVDGGVEGDFPFTYQWFRDGVSVGTTPGFSYTHPPDNVPHTYSVLISNARGSTQSQVISSRLTPLITLQPVSQTLQLRQPLVLTVAAEASDPITYQWFKNGLLVGSGPRLEVANVTAMNAGVYRAVARNVNASVNSQDVQVTVLDGATPAVQLPKFTLHPLSMIVNAGSTATFTSEAVSSVGFTYQWFRDGQPLAGETRATLSLFSLDISRAGIYTVSAKSATTETMSAPAKLTVREGAPVLNRITAVTNGSTVSLNISALGTQPMTYEWSKDGAVLPISAFNFISVTATSTRAAYTVKVRNSIGEATSAPYDVVLAPVVASALKIVSQPESQVVKPGALFGLSVNVSGTAPYTYQWYKDGNAIGGATLYYHDTASAAAAQSGKYSVRVTDALGAAVKSADAVIQVTNDEIAPTILKQPVAASVGYNESVVLSVSVLASPTVTYTWSRDGVQLSDRGGFTYNTSMPGLYSVRISNGKGAVTSDTVKVTRQLFSVPQASPNQVNIPGLGEFTLDGGF